MTAHEHINTHASLLRRIKDVDDDASWREFDTTYRKLIFGMAKKAGLSEDEANEVVQDVFVTISKNIKELKYDPAVGSFKGFLGQTTRWRISDRLRKRRPEEINRQHRPEGDNRNTGTLDRIGDPNALDLDAMFEDEWREHLRDTALEMVKTMVSARQFQIFDCYVVQGWPARKVAKMLGVSLIQVYLARNRILPLLKDAASRLKKDTETLPPGSPKT